MRTRKNRRFSQEIVALAAVLAAASAAADVVYDASASGFGILRGSFVAESVRVGGKIHGEICRAKCGVNRI